MLPLHPAAELFPPMLPADYAALRDDIAARGVLTPVWVLDGQILDGRHRAQACDELGIECPTQPYPGADPVGFVLALNARRRMLNASQRALIGARLANLGNGQTKRWNSSALVRSYSSADAAQRMQVSTRSVESARVLLNTEHQDIARSLIDDVAAGLLPVKTALKELKHRIAALAIDMAAAKAQVAARAEALAHEAERQASYQEALDREAERNAPQLRAMEEQARLFVRFHDLLGELLDVARQIVWDEPAIRQAQPGFTTLEEILHGAP